MNLSGDCVRDIKKAFSTPSLHLSPYYDSSGKVSAGVLEGATSWLGNYYQCTALPHARYCLLQLSIAHPHKESAIKWGLCAVSSCNSTDIQENVQDLLDLGLPDNGFHFSNATVTCAESPVTETGYYGTIGFLLSLVALCALGTVIEYVHRYRVRHHPKLVHKITARGPHLVSADGTTSSYGSSSSGGDGIPVLADTDDEEWDRPPLVTTIHNALKPGWLTVFFTCFSASHNLRRLLSPPPACQHIPCLHGLRVLCMAWVVAAHTYMAVFFSDNLVNPTAAHAYSKMLVWQPIGNAYFAADTFFFMSGVLVCYHGLNTMRNNNGKLSLFYFYLHRYVRLTPLLGLVMLLWLFVKPQLGDGPLWFHVSEGQCEKYWWTNLLYIQNFYPGEYHKQCMGWLWYLALDFQFYLLAPVFIWLLYRYPRQGVALMGCVLLASIVVTAALIGAYDIDVDLTNSLANMDYSSAHAYWSVIYTKPYCRIAPYVVGMLTGYVLYLETGQSRAIAKVAVVMLWLLSVGVVVLLLLAFWLPPAFGTAPAAQTAQNIAYGALCHAAWALATATALYMCVHGYGACVSSALSWTGWAALSRLTYGVFLLHPLLLSVIIYSSTVAIYVSTLTMAQYFCFTLVVAYLGAAVFMLLLELPLANLQQLLVGTKPAPVTL